MKRSPLITLTTDFGSDSPYVAQMKAVLLSRIAEVTLVDVTHSIPAQDVAAAAHVLSESLSWFPAESVHLGVVDPGVGTQRRIIAGECQFGHFVGPDNGLFSGCGIVSAVNLDQPRFWQRDVSATFHGRDVMSPVAAAIASGTPLVELGSPIEDWVTLQSNAPVRDEGNTVGEVIYVDSFGNLVTNLKAENVGTATEVMIDDRAVPVVRTYGQAAPGETVALCGSSGRLEIAVVNGNAERSWGRTIAVKVCPSSLGNQKGSGHLF